MMTRDLCRVVIIDDSLYEGQESFNVTLATPMGGRLGAEHPSVHIVILPHHDDGKEKEEFMCKLNVFFCVCVCVS